MDPCLCERNHFVNGRVIILVYVDNLVMASESFAGVEAIKSGVSANL